MIHSLHTQKKQTFLGSRSGHFGETVPLFEDVFRTCRRFFLFSLGLFFVSIIFYLFGTNNIAAKGHEMRLVEAKIVAVRDEYKRLQIEEAELKSPYSFEQNNFGLEAIHPAEVSYIQERGSVAYFK